MSVPTQPPKPGSLPPPTGRPAKLATVEDEPDDPTRLMDRRPAQPMASIFTAPTKILPRVESGGVLRIIGANLIAYTRRPTVNLVLLLLAGTLLVGMGFVLGSTRKDPTLPAPPESQAVDRSASRAPIVRTAAPTAIASAPIAAIAVSSLPVAPPKEQAGALRAIPASSPGHVSSPDFPLPADRPPVPADKGFVPPVRNPGF